MTDWRPRARRLGATLAAGGLVDSSWRLAFEVTPRHLFVPFFYDDHGTRIDAGDPDAWLDAVYADDSLVTQMIPVEGSPTGWPTSSSTRPGLMAQMLQLLDLRDDSRVLEIGTGTGYNAALLCHRLGDANVTSIDIDPALVDVAGDRLAELGYRPSLTAGDGADGVPDHAPYDRIIATCAVSRIPPAWITQLTPGGLIVADVRGDLASNLVALRKDAPDTVSGRFLTAPGHFMWLRPTADNPFRTGDSLVLTIARDDLAHTMTEVDPALLEDRGFRFVLQLHAPDIQHPWREDRSGNEVLTLYAADGAWAEVATTPDDGGQYGVTQGGPRRIWPAVEQAAATWRDLDRPSCAAFGITATLRRTEVWFGHPGSVHTWVLP